MAVQPRCRCPYLYGGFSSSRKPEGMEFAPRFAEARCTFIQSWYPDREVPTSANLNLYGGSGSRVRWHSDDEDLFARRGESKLIVLNELWGFGAFQVATWA